MRLSLTINPTLSTETYNRERHTAPSFLRRRIWTQCLAFQVLNFSLRCGQKSSSESTPFDFSFFPLVFKSRDACCYLCDFFLCFKDWWWWVWQPPTITNGGNCNRWVGCKPKFLGQRLGHCHELPRRVWAHPQSYKGHMAISASKESCKHLFSPNISWKSQSLTTLTHCIVPWSFKIRFLGTWRWVSKVWRWGKAQSFEIQTANSLHINCYIF